MMKTQNWKILYCNVQSTRNFSEHNKGGCPISKGRIDRENKEDRRVGEGKRDGNGQMRRGRMGCGGKIRR